MDIHCELCDKSTSFDFIGHNSVLNTRTYECSECSANRVDLTEIEKIEYYLQMYEDLHNFYAYELGYEAGKEISAEQRDYIETYGNLCSLIADSKTRLEELRK